MQQHNKGPLRKVVDRYMIDPITKERTSTSGVLIEVLECGHIVRTRQDIYGETYAVRRRCKK